MSSQAWALHRLSGWHQSVADPAVMRVRAGARPFDGGRRMCVSGDRTGVRGVSISRRGQSFSRWSASGWEGNPMWVALAILGVLVVFNGEFRVLAVAAGALLLWVGHKRSNTLLTAIGAGFLALMLYAAY